MIDQPGRWRCFGTDWLSDIALDQFDAAQAAASGVPVTINRTQALSPVTGGRQLGRLTIGDDGLLFRWNRDAAFRIDNDGIGWAAGPDWTGTMPVAFYGTVAALVLARAGHVPMHASSVVIDGKAWLLAGDAGVGKSTLAAELVGAGMPLLADDLTITSGDSADGSAGVALRGRPAMRLHPSATGWLDHSSAEAMAGDPRGKWLVRPGCRAADRPWPVGGIILLRDGADLTAAGRIGALAAAQFRPRIMAALPGHGLRRAALLRLGAAIPVLSLPPVCGFTKGDRARRVDAVRAAIAGAPVVP